MQLKVGPTGKLIQGHLYDVNRYSFTAALKRFDPMLYLVWNPAKRRGLGCWEIHQRPLKKTAIYHGEFEDQALFSVEEVSNPLISHIMDVPFLSYSTFDRLKAADAWENKNWVADLMALEKSEQERLLKKTRDDLEYGLKQDRKIYREFQEMVNSGLNPALLAHYWGSKSQN